MTKKRVVVKDLMQMGYVYHLTEPVGKHFHPNFRAQLTPKEMLELGVFGGKYMTDCTAEFPIDWFVKVRLCSERHDPDLNLFGVNASQPLAEWRRKGWIYEEDPRGWLQVTVPLAGPRSGLAPLHNIACRAHLRIDFEKQRHNTLYAS